MKIGVVADTHSQEIPKQLLDDFKKTDMILHAGDFCSWKDYKIFSEIKEVKAVYGNMDDERIRKKFPSRQILQIGNIFVGITHGNGSPEKILTSIREEFKRDKVDVIIFGHSHQPLSKSINNVLFFNPGSPNDKILSPYCSYGIIEIVGNKITSKIIKVN